MFTLILGTRSPALPPTPALTPAATCSFDVQPSCSSCGRHHVMPYAHTVPHAVLWATRCHAILVRTHCAPHTLCGPARGVVSKGMPTRLGGCWWGVHWCIVHVRHRTNAQANTRLAVVRGVEKVSGEPAAGVMKASVCRAPYCSGAGRGGPPPLTAFLTFISRQR